MPDIRNILDLAAATDYDFRRSANPEGPLKYLFSEWVPYYRVKWATARALQPKRILEIGVRFGYSAAAFLDACPDAAYLGIDDDSDKSGGQKGAILCDSQQFEEFPRGPYDLIHIDGQQDGAGLIADLRKALRQARRILVDGLF